MLGTTFFDGFSRTSIWQYKYSFSWYNVQVDLIDRPHLADIVGQLMNVGGMLVCVLFVGLSFRLAIAGTESIGERKGLAPEFVDSLIPIALVYVIAHYFSLLVFQGEVGYKLVSDPWGRGWDLFGTHNFTPNFTFLTPHYDLYVRGRRSRDRPRRRAGGRPRPGGRHLPLAAAGAVGAVPDADPDDRVHHRRALGSEPEMTLLAHGGIPGLIAETSCVIVALGVFGYFVRRSAKKEERERTKRGGSDPDGSDPPENASNRSPRLLRIRPVRRPRPSSPTDRPSRKEPQECAKHGHSCCWRSSERCSQPSSSVVSARARRTRPATARRL
jgi:hypothetical protein